MHVSAKITGLKYTPYSYKTLKSFDISDLETCLARGSAFLLNINPYAQVAVSSWVSAKRSRSYPNAKIYECLSYQGKKITIIPLYKDEGKGGDRDYLQWDTISLMSLLGVYTIISYYIKAEPNPRRPNKITKQRFDIAHLNEELNALLSYQSDALHWNLSQIDKIGEIGQKALDSYQNISEQLGIAMHPAKSAKRKIEHLLKNRETFMDSSRELAQKAQQREAITIQPKEKISGTKASLTIKNYLGGYYFFTCDEVEISGDTISLIESKHSKEDELPSLGDIKEGLIRMILFTNLKNVMVGGTEYSPVAVLKLTTNGEFSLNKLNKIKLNQLRLLKKEAKENGFRIFINNTNLQEIEFSDSE
jgi:hypothetical protein